MSSNFKGLLDEPVCVWGGEGKPSLGTIWLFELNGVSVVSITLQIFVTSQVTCARQSSALDDFRIMAALHGGTRSE